MPFFSFEALRSKRVLGWLSWQVRRRRRYRPAVLEALLTDLAQTAPDQLAITGDLTQIALASELREAAGWLTRFERSASNEKNGTRVACRSEMCASVAMAAPAGAPA